MLCLNVFAFRLFDLIDFRTFYQMLATSANEQSSIDPYTRNNDHYFNKVFVWCELQWSDYIKIFERGSHEIRNRYVSAKKET